MTISVVASCCGPPNYPGDELDRLPPDAVGVVSVSPLGLKSLRSRDRTVLFAYDNSGEVLGKIEGAAQYSSWTVVAPNTVVKGTGRAVSVLTPESRKDFEFDYQGMGQAAAGNDRTGAATFWFVDGRSNDYVHVSADGTSTSGEIPGTVQTASYCGDSAFALVEDSWSREPYDAPSSRRLYELDTNGALTVRGEWVEARDVSPASRSSVCSSEGRLLSLLTSDRARDEDADVGLTLVGVDVADGSRTVTDLGMTGLEKTVRGMTSDDTRLRWLNNKGALLSVPITSTVPAEEKVAVTTEWSVPGWNDDVSVSVGATEVTVLDYHDTPTVTRYDLLSGDPVGGPISLPWLESIVGESTETGNSVYGVAGVASVPR